MNDEQEHACCQTWGEDCPTHGHLMDDYPDEDDLPKWQRWAYGSAIACAFVGFTMAVIGLATYDPTHNHDKAAPSVAPNVAPSTQQPMPSNREHSSGPSWHLLDHTTEEIIDGKIKASDVFDIELFSKPIPEGIQSCTALDAPIKSEPVKITATSRNGSLNWYNSPIVISGETQGFDFDTVVICDKSTNLALVYIPLQMHVDGGNNLIIDESQPVIMIGP